MEKTNDNNITPETIVSLNVGGVIFQTKISTFSMINEKDHSLLSKMFDLKQPFQLKTSYFFDRDSKIFESVLRYYRTGIFISPIDIPDEYVQIELDFWQIHPSSVQKIDKTLNDYSLESFAQNSANLIHDLIDLYLKTFKTKIYLPEYIWDFSKTKTIEIDDLVITPQLLDNMLLSKDEIYKCCHFRLREKTLYRNTHNDGPINFPLSSIIKEIERDKYWDNVRRFSLIYDKKEEIPIPKDNSRCCIQ